MRIVHLDLAGFYTENTVYQTNVLSDINAQDGNETTVVSTNFHWEGYRIVQTPLCDEMLAPNLRLIRLSYANPSPDFNRQKFRRVLGLYDTLERLQPDVLFCHCTQFYSVLDVVRYKKRHPKVKLFVDTHSDANNSGKSWISLHILHRLYYRALTQRVLPYVERFFYLGEDNRLFAVRNYGVPESLMEFYPLGGLAPAPEAYDKNRTVRRRELGLTPDDILLLHSGKLDALKRTEDLLHALESVPDPRLKLAVLGSIPEEMRLILQPLIEADSRVMYLGWKSAEELKEYLCACDVYCQPGSMSATMQSAVCCGCGILLQPTPSYEKGYDWGNIIWVKTQQDMEKALQEILDGTVDLEKLKENSRRCAGELLDYRRLAARLYPD